MQKAIETDVLVVGGGAAGCRAAIEARDAGAKVTLAVKGLFGRIGGLRGSGATGATDSFGFMCSPDLGRYVYGGAGGATTPEEEKEIYFKYALQVGLGMADRRLMRILVEEISPAKKRLKEWGVVFEDNEPFMRSYIAPTPGMACVIRGLGNIAILEHFMVTNLIIQDDVCVGAIGINELDGKSFLIKTKAVILATGGTGQLFLHNFQPLCVTGDGYAMAYEAGAELLNMEFQQIIWTIIYPTVNTLSGIYRPKLFNIEGKEFLQDYLPKGVTANDVLDKKLQHWPFTSRDISRYLDIAAVKEAKAGRASEHNGFYISTTEVLNAKKKVFRELMEWYHTHGVDLNKEYLEVSPSYHCHHGGIRIDENAQTTIPRLYAIGETAAGPYGVDRLGGCMMAFSQVFGVRAARHAAAIATETESFDIDKSLVDNELDRIDKFKECTGSVNPVEYKKRLQKKTWENLLIVRSEESLKETFLEIEAIRDGIKSNLAVANPADLVNALELYNLLKVGEIMAAAALEREESRGNHYRDDYPKRDDNNWLHSITINKHDGEMTLGKLVRDEEWKDLPGDMGDMKWG